MTVLTSVTETQHNVVKGWRRIQELMVEWLAYQLTLLAGDDHSTPRSVKLTHSLYPTRQSEPLSTALCSHCSLRALWGTRAVEDPSIDWYSEVRTGGCGDNTTINTLACTHYLHMLELTHSTLHHSHKPWWCLHWQCSQCHRCRWPQCPLILSP